MTFSFKRVQGQIHPIFFFLIIYKSVISILNNEHIITIVSILSNIKLSFHLAVHSIKSIIICKLFVKQKGKSCQDNISYKTCN